MIVLLDNDSDRALVRAALQGLGLWASPRHGADGQIDALVLADPSPPIGVSRIASIPGVRDVLAAPSPHPRVDRQVLSTRALPEVCREGATLMAGPCSVESPQQIDACATIAKRAGATFLRGGAFKPRTSPYSFDGKGIEALRWMREAADAHGLRVVTEALSEKHAAIVAAHADLIQIGARNMANYALLAAVGSTAKPVLLKRSPAATVEEWLLAGEHLLNHGASSVVFCERGVRSFDSGTRYSLDVSAIARLKHVHGQVVIVDPSHAAGRRDLVQPLALAGLAAGADGAIVEFHPSARDALSDGPQALSPSEIVALGLAIGTISGRESAPCQSIETSGVTR